MSRLSDMPLVCLGYHPWSTMWKRNQSMVGELAEQRLVRQALFLNPELSVPTPPGRIVQEWKTVRRYCYTHIRPRRRAENLVVMTPVHWIPMRGRSTVLRRLDQSILRGAIERALGSNEPYVLLMNAFRPEGEELLDLLQPHARLTVLDWSDDFSSFPLDAGQRRRIAELTERLIRRVDHVIAVNERLATQAGQLHQHVDTVINATNMEPSSAASPRLEGARALRARFGEAPVVGYAGFINEHRVDRDLVVELARRHPEWQFLFVGIVQLDFDQRFPDLDNIHFHPAVPYHQLQDYLEVFDVSLIPHLLNEHTSGNNPLKLYDYLSTGRPVVSTPVAGTDAFADVIAVADGVDAFEAAVVDALERRGDDEARQRRLGRAAENHWRTRVLEVAAILEGALDRTRAAHGDDAAQASQRSA